MLRISGKTAVMTAVLLVTSAAGGCGGGTTVDGAGSSALLPPPTTPVTAPNDCLTAEKKVPERFPGGATIQPGSYPLSFQLGGPPPADLQAVSLLECVDHQQELPGAGRWVIVDTMRSTGPVDAFVTALRAAFAAKPTNTACPAADAVVPWIALVDAHGHAYQVRIPTGYCGVPDQTAFDALGAVPLMKAGTDPVGKVTGNRGACPPQAGDTPMFNLPPGSMPGDGSTARPFFAKPGVTKDLQVCYYTLDANHNDIKPVGSLKASASLTGAEAASVYDGLVAAPVAMACTTASTTFAVVFTDDVLHGISAVVELDGCRRAAASLDSIRMPSQSAVDALIAARPA